MRRNHANRPIFMTPAEHADMVAFREKRSLRGQRRRNWRLITALCLAVALSFVITAFVVTAVLALVR